jgi:hypothetical protein
MTAWAIRTRLGSHSSGGAWSYMRRPDRVDYLSPRKRDAWSTMDLRVAMGVAEALTDANPSIYFEVVDLWESPLEFPATTTL